MDIMRVAVWAVMMLVIGLAYTLMSPAADAGLVQAWWGVVQSWWLTALVSALLIYFVVQQLDDPDAPYWVVWGVCMAIYLTLYGRVMHGDWSGVMLWWHWAVAALSAVVMHYMAPWGRRYLAA